MNTKRKLMILVHWVFTVFTIIYILTGFGITNYQIITPMTFGFLSKASSLQLHTTLIYPFILLFTLHILLTTYKKIGRLLKKHGKRTN